MTKISKNLNQIEIRKRRKQARTFSDRNLSNKQYPLVTPTLAGGLCEDHMSYHRFFRSDCV